MPQGLPNNAQHIPKGHTAPYGTAAVTPDPDIPMPSIEPADPHIEFVEGRDLQTHPTTSASHEMDNEIPPALEHLPIPQLELDQAFEDFMWITESGQKRKKRLRKEGDADYRVMLGSARGG